MKWRSKVKFLGIWENIWVSSWHWNNTTTCWDCGAKHNSTRKRKERTEFSFTSKDAVPRHLKLGCYLSVTPPYKRNFVQGKRFSRILVPETWIDIKGKIPPVISLRLTIFQDSVFYGKSYDISNKKSPQSDQRFKSY